MEEWAPEVKLVVQVESLARAVRLAVAAESEARVLTAQAGRRWHAGQASPLEELVVAAGPHEVAQAELEPSPSARLGTRATAVALS